MKQASVPQKWSPIRQLIKGHARVNKEQVGGYAAGYHLKPASVPQKWLPSWIRGREPRMQLLSVIRPKSTSNPQPVSLTTQPLTTHNLCPTCLPRPPSAVHCLISKSKRPPAACHAPKSPSPHSFRPLHPFPHSHTPPVSRSHNLAPRYSQSHCACLQCCRRSLIEPPAGPNENTGPRRKIAANGNLHPCCIKVCNA